MKYEVMISEAQRAFLEKVLAEHQLELNASEDDNLKYFYEVIRDLPASEKESPGVLHGLCL